VGFGWNLERANTGRGKQPKLTVVGRMEGSVFGRPVTIDASGKEIALHLPSLASAWRLHRFAGELIRPFAAFSTQPGSEITLRLQVARWPTLEVFPNPSSGLRLLVPQLNRLRRQNR
jgi:hypothetical protein